MSVEEYLAYWNSMNWDYIIRNHREGKLTYFIQLGVLPLGHSMHKYVQGEGVTLLDACEFVNVLGEQLIREWNFLH